MNELTNFLSSSAMAKVDPQDLANALQETRQEVQSGAGGAGVDYLTFSGKSGEWLIGTDKEAIDPSEYWLISPPHTFRGWICWVKSKVAAKHEWLVTDRKAAIEQDELDDHGPYRPNTGDGWHRMVGLMMVRPASGRPAKFATNSASGRNSVSDLLGESAQRAAKGEPYFPVVQLDATEFTAQDMKNFKPVFNVVVWVSEAAAEAYAAEEISLDDLIQGEEKPRAKGRKGGASSRAA